VARWGGPARAGGGGVMEVAAHANSSIAPELSRTHAPVAGEDASQTNSDAVRAAFQAGFQAGVSEGRRCLASEVLVGLRQYGLDLVAAARRADVLLGNSSGVGSVAALGALPAAQPQGPGGPAVGDAPAPAAPRTAGPGYRTLERLEILARDWPAGVPHDVIADRMDALPGPLVNRGALAVWAAQAGLRRPAGWSRHHPWPPPASYDEPTACVDADRRTIRAWAEAHGLRFEGRHDLVAVNRVRVGRNLPLFRLT
jgi:hypothetical protein